DGGAGADAHRHLGRQVLANTRWGADEPDAGVGLATDRPRGPPAFDRDWPVRADFLHEVLERAHSHAPSGTRSRCCTSPQLAPVGSTFAGLSTPSESNARRSRF